ncbi:hypothetical protein A4U60_17390 [Priestia endophytica]|nr:hypothetical protein A4U60_17390 [Priestia endophytica]
MYRKKRKVKSCRGKRSFYSSTFIYSRELQVLGSQVFLHSESSGVNPTLPLCCLILMRVSERSNFSHLRLIGQSGCKKER